MHVIPSRMDWTLLAIACADGDPLSPVQLQKVLFLLGREMPAEAGPEFYKFRPYNYGPFDSAVYADAEALTDAGLVTLVPHWRWNEYAATPEGMARAEQVRAAAPTAAHEYLSKVVAWARGLSFQDLVRAIYARYPDTRAKSIFEDRQA